MSKPRLYIDVDDTIIAVCFPSNGGLGAGGLELRPGVVTQIKFLSRMFDCYWLTHWSKERLKELWYLVYASTALKDVQYCNWREVNSSDKAPAVLGGPRDFYWLEDPLSTGSMTLLEEGGLIDRYIPVEPRGLWGFTRALNVLFDKAQITTNDIKRVGANPVWFKEPLGDHFDWTFVE